MKRLFIFMLVAVVMASFCSIARPAGLSRISEALDVRRELVNPDSENTAASKTDYVAELNKIGMAGRSESDNAAPYYQRAIELYIEKPEGLRIQTSLWPKEYPAQQHAMIKTWVQNNGRALEQLQLASQKQYYWHKYTGQKIQISESTSQYPDLHTIRDLARALENRAMISAEDGNITSALNDIETLYTIGAQMSIGPKPMIEKLVGIAVKALPIRVVYDMLERKMLDANSMKTLEERFKRLVDEYSEPLDMRCEKMFLQEQVETDPKYSGLKPYLKSTLEYYDSTAAKTPVQLHNEAQSAGEQNPLIKTAGAGFARVVELEHRIRTDEQALITTLAILRYNAGSDAYPRDLQQMVSAGYITEVPKDPYSDNPLVYKQTRDGFTLYSYGEDFDDDGGKHSKWGVGDEGGDQVFWPVEQSQTAQRQPRREERGPYYAQTEPQTERTSFRAGQSDTSDKTLHDAVVTGDIAQVKALLSRGVDINMKNRMSWTPLHTAIQNRREEIARLLIERNADLNAKNNRGQTPLHVAVNTGQKEIVELLISKGADVNVMAGSDNALTFAQKRRDQEIIDILVKNGAKEPSPEDLMGDRYYPGAENPYGDYQQQTSAPSRSTRGYRAVAQPVEVDILADPNEIKARIKTFAGLAKALEVVDANSQRETRQWLQTRYDNRTMLLRTVQKQFEDEMDLIKEAAVSENAQKTAKAIESAVALRQQRFEATKKELLEQRREQRMAERMSGRTRGRGRVSARSSRGYGSYDEQEHDSYGRYDRYDRAGADPYGRAGRTAPGTRYPGTTDEQTEAVDAEGQNETRQWLQTNFDDKTDLAGAVNDQIRAELTAIRDIAVEESAKKTTAAIDGVLLTRHMRLEDFLAEWQEQQAEQALRQQAYDPRTRGRYQQDSRYDRGGTTGGYPQRGRSRGRRRR